MPPGIVHVLRGGDFLPMQRQVGLIRPDLSPDYDYLANTWNRAVTIPIGVRCIFDEAPEPLAMWESMTLVDARSSSGR